MNNNKKIGLYIGVALIVGALGFVIYTKLASKKIDLKNNLDEVDTKDETSTSSKWQKPKPFSSNPANQLTASQLSIKAPAFTTDLLNSFK
jgi:hypothetical protein